ncbi:MAG TPA: ThuA domain-containing protein [Ohtaekwangia sp.]
MRYSIFIFCAAILLAACSKRSGKPKVLIFSKTAGYHHASIPDGIAAIQKLGAQNNFDIDTTTNAASFTEENLKQYSAVIFLCTTGDVLNNYQEADFERYIQAGGGYVGVHAASDTEYDWGWYGRLVGGYYADHPGINDSFPNVQDGMLQVIEKNHSSTDSLPEDWKRKDEWYSFKKLNPETKVLLKIDENSYHGGKKMGDHPMAWYHDYDGGRAFYTALGHTKESYSEPLFLKHLSGGIEYAIGDNRELNYGKATTLRVPEEDRFTKTMLATGQFFEPTEMTILPNLDILISQRRGEILLYKHGDSTVKQVGFLDAYFKAKTRADVNAEEGVLGIKADPDFARNHYVFIFYSPADTSVNRLSRFKFENDVLDMKSEQVILQFYSQREICCHTGGSIAFDKDGLLYVSTGDNSTPFNEGGQPYVNHGFAPLDDRPGHEQYDARRSSGNANDLRGKIIRIKVNDDGTYSIPEGNLYPEGTEGTRPEIYVQGNRNPYRISVDQKNGFLYWGEVGPDANNDSLANRGPRGYDEVNQARKAGFFGWPLFVGNNYAYRNYDYSTGKSTQDFDPANPVNNSRNNTGIKELPPAQPAFIWYPYGASPDFPQVETGGRNAMAGPVYYTDLYDKSTRMPEYYNNKLFIYDWVRGWIKAVTLQPNGDYDKMEPFMAHTRLNALIDMEVGPDGKLYFLEYGNGWFRKNPDSGLSRVDFTEGNLPPKIGEFSVSKNSGMLPLAFTAKVTASDFEKDNLTYRWNFGDGTLKETNEPSIDYIFTKSGEYNVQVEVVDAKSASVKSMPAVIYAGNAMPAISIHLKGNKTFYFPGKKVGYSVDVTDADDPSASTNLTGLFISADYTDSRDRAAATPGHQNVTDAAIGKNLTQSLDCKACHKENEKSIGPSYKEVAAHYQKDANAFSYLSNKIIKGGSGVWGEVNMPAHGSMKEGEARQIITWIMSLNQTEKEKSLPPYGILNASLDKPLIETGRLTISASYTDNGGSIGKSLTANDAITLRHHKMNFNGTTEIKEFTNFNENRRRIMVTPRGTGSFKMSGIDLTDITKISIGAYWKKAVTHSYTYEIHLDAPDGKKIGEMIFKPQVKTAGELTLTTSCEKISDGKFHDLYLVSKTTNEDGAEIVYLKDIQFN